MIGKMSKFVAWFPYTLREKSKRDYIFIATSLLSRLRNDLFLKNIGDKKRVFYDNVLCKGK